MFGNATIRFYFSPYLLTPAQNGNSILIQIVSNFFKEKGDYKSDDGDQVAEVLAK